MKNPARIIGGLTLLMTMGGFSPGAFSEEPVYRSFVMPWDDGSPAFPSLAGLNDPSTPRVTVSKDGHFAAKGERIRFMGVNITAASAFAAPPDAHAVAGRLAKFGVNCVRFHHLEAPWMPEEALIDYGTGGSRSLRPENLERLHSFVAALAERGIYSNVNLLVSRKFTAADGLTPEIEKIDWKEQHILGFFDEKMFELQTEYASQLLLPANPYRKGVSLAKDPAVAFVEVINENGLIQKWLDGSVAKLPPLYREKLRSSWNNWLSQKYPDAAAVRAAWKIRSEPEGAEILGPGAGTPRTPDWYLEQHEGAVAFLMTGGMEGATWARVDTQGGAKAAWHVQLQRSGLTVDKSKIYTVSFRARTSAPRNMEVLLQRDSGDYGTIGLQREVRLGTDWSDFVFTFIPDETTDKARLNFTGLGASAGKIDFANVSIKEGGSLGAPAGGIKLGDLPLPGNAAWNPTIEGKTDFMAFLNALEVSYHERFRAFLRERVNCEALLVGTIMANSSVAAMSPYEAIDSHAYWQHPQFPRGDWSNEHWTVQNTSMVSEPKEATVGWLALQRIIGKPFLVTEYQHPSPNVFSAEGPLFIGAYGSLQDWDGVWFFDYGSGADNWRRGKFSSFFDMDQHPTKMVNLLAGAAMFRQGLVKPARTTVGALIDPDGEATLLARRAGAWNVASAKNLDVNPMLSLMYRTGIRTSGKSDLVPNVNFAGTLQSDTKELSWKQENGKASEVLLLAPSAKAVWGFVDNKGTELGDANFKVGTTANGWCTIALVALDRKDSKRLLAVTGDVRNRGMKWKDGKRSTLGADWGNAPVEAECIPLRIEFHGVPRRITALGPEGQPEWSSQTKEEGGAQVVEIPADKASIWYLVENVK